MPKWLEIEGPKRMNLDDLVRFSKADIAAGRQKRTSYVRACFLLETQEKKNLPLLRANNV